jgi:hypothetical protein
MPNKHHLALRHCVSRNVLMVKDCAHEEEHWGRILTIFGQSFLQVFQAYPAVFQAGRELPILSLHLAPGCDSRRSKK